MLPDQFITFVKTVPTPVWIGVAAAIITAVGFGFGLWRKVASERTRLTSIGDQMSAIFGTAKHTLGGASLHQVEQVREVFAEPPNHTLPWDSFEGQLFSRQVLSSGGVEERYYRSSDSGAIFTHDALWGRRINIGLYTSIPSVVTSIGLATTFLAICIALYGLSPDAGGIYDLHPLIGGLAGKFVSSIVALLFAVLYLFAEKRILHSLQSARSELVKILDRGFPRLPSEALLAELQRDIAEQSNAFRLFNADLSTQLKNSFSESLGPTLGRMVESIEELNRHLQVAEAKRTESITGQLGGLLERLEESITSSLGAVTREFTSSISGSAQAQFSDLTRVLQQSTEALSQVNLESASTHQMAKNEAERSISRMASAVEELSSMFANSTGRMADTATSVIDDADRRSKAREQALSQMLTVQNEQLQSAFDMKAVLDESARTFEALLTKHAAASIALRDLVGILNDSAERIRSANDIAAGLQKMSVKEAETLRSTQQESIALWSQMHQRLEDFGRVFGEAEASTETLITHITDAMTAYSSTASQGYQALTAVANDHFTNAASSFSSNIGSLTEAVRELAELVERLSSSANPKDGTRQ